MLRFMLPILALSLLLVPTVALAQEGSDSPSALLLGKVTTGSSDSNNPTVYVFESEGPGLLTVALRGQSDTDLRIAITDDLGQSLPEGTSDRDIGGAPGAALLPNGACVGVEHCRVLRRLCHADVVELLPVPTHRLRPAHAA